MPLDDLAGRPHVLVDGAARAGTVLTLSHWPAATTPRELWRDLSAEIAFAYLAAPQRWDRRAVAVTNDHLDADGLVALYALVDPVAALERRALLEGVARAGDFNLVDSPEAARVAFALRALCDRGRSPLRGTDVGGTAWTGACSAQVLDLLPDLLEHPERFREHWADEEEALVASQRALQLGEATVEERPESALAVVRLAKSIAAAHGAVGHATEIGLHRAAVHAVTAAPRVLVLEPERSTYYDRYETWVRLVSRQLPRRVDLQPLAAQLTAAEPAGLQWTADPPGCTEAVLACAGRTGIPEVELIEALCRHLAEAPPAWDPYAASPFRPDVAGPDVGGRDAVSAAAASRAGTSGRARARWGGRRRAGP